MKPKYIAIMLSLCTLIFVSVFSSLLYGKRPLTSTEIDLLQPIYQSSVNLDRIRIKSGGPLTWVYPGITIGNAISFPEGAYDETDEKDMALLVHEVCHVWQFQNFGVNYIPRSLWELVTQRDTHVIHYDATKSFQEYDVEEQCEIVAEYFLTSDSRYDAYINEVRLQE